MEDLKIFDKDGKELHVADVIYKYIINKAELSNKDVSDVYLGVYQFHKTWIECYEEVDNGYDGVNLNSFGDMDEVEPLS